MSLCCSILFARPSKSLKLNQKYNVESIEIIGEISRSWSRAFYHCATTRRSRALTGQNSLKGSFRGDLVVRRCFIPSEIKLNRIEKMKKFILPWFLVHFAGFISGLSSKLSFLYLGTVFEFSWNHDLPGNDRGKNEREVLQENKGNENFSDRNGDPFFLLGNFSQNKVHCFWLWWH